MSSCILVGVVYLSLAVLAMWIVWCQLAIFWGFGLLDWLKNILLYISLNCYCAFTGPGSALAQSDDKANAQDIEIEDEDDMEVEDEEEEEEPVTVPDSIEEGDVVS